MTTTRAAAFAARSPHEVRFKPPNTSPVARKGHLKHRCRSIAFITGSFTLHPRLTRHSGCMQPPIELMIAPASTSPYYDALQVSSRVHLSLLPALRRTGYDLHWAAFRCDRAPAQVRTRMSAGSKQLHVRALSAQAGLRLPALERSGSSSMIYAATGTQPAPTLPNAPRVVVSCAGEAAVARGQPRRPIREAIE